MGWFNTLFGHKPTKPARRPARRRTVSGAGLRALSVRQPWAGLLVAGVKRFEARTWKPRELGFLLVHASAGKAGDLRDLRADPLYQRSLRQAGMSDEQSWPRSVFIGLVE